MKTQIQQLNTLKQRAIIAYHKWQASNNDELLARDYLRIQAKIAELNHLLQIKG